MKSKVKPTSQFQYGGILDVNPGQLKTRVVIGTPTTGSVRVEWMMSRYGQTIPCNWSHMDLLQFMSPFVPINYQVADAENLIAKAAVENNAEWCFKADTLVTTISGAKRIRDIEVGDNVLTHLGRFRPVTRTMSRSMKSKISKIYWVSTANSVTKVTPGHPYLIKRGSVFLFITAQELMPGDLLCYPLQQGSNPSVDFNVRYNSVASGYHNLVGGKRNSVRLDAVPVSAPLARFLGLYMAEGHADKSGLAFTFSSDEPELIEEVQRTSVDLFGRAAHVCTSKETTRQVRISIKNLAPLFKSWFGSYARTKRVPKFVFDWPLVNKLHFLKAYLEGDGTCSKGMTFYSTASERLIEDIERLSRSCGLLTSSRQHLVQRESPQSDGSVIRGGQSLFSGGLTTKATQLMDDLLSTVESDAHYMFVPVVDVVRHDWAGSLKDNFVYNLEVAQDHTYVANSGAVHNCLMWEHDNVPQNDAIVKLNEYMLSADVPVVGGLYFTKSIPPEPMTYRGIGNSYYSDWKLGDKVWCDGIPFGFTLIHCSLIRKLWEESPEYLVNGQITRRVFEAPASSWMDEARGAYFNVGGTSDLAWCQRVMKDRIFEKAGWSKYQKKKYPFLIDTSIFVSHIDEQGTRWPLQIPRNLLPTKKSQSAAPAAAGRRR